MARNIEIKAALQDIAAAHSIARRLSQAAPEIIYQQDVFFNCPRERLKLRIFGPEMGELIRYERADSTEARLSRYSIARTSDPQIMRDILNQALGKRGIVTKTRSLYLVGQTRIHIDQVEGLGDFLELEVVLRPEQAESEGGAIAETLLAEFGIRAEQRIAEAYVDLLARGKAG